MINQAYFQDFEDISKTAFWRAYETELQSVRETLVKQLTKNSDIGDPATVGDVWQGCLMVVEQILRVPQKLIGKAEGA